MLQLTKAGNEPLPLNRLKVGSPVVISDDDNPKDPGIPGVVSRRTRDVIQVATEAWPDASWLTDLSPGRNNSTTTPAAMAT